jgi:hypothetical protein
LVKANGTHAKDIAIHFLNNTQERYTSAMVAKTIVQAKKLLEDGYTKEEIIDVINYIVDKTSVQMYSLGYVSTAINSVLRKIEEEKEAQRISDLVEQQKQEYDAIRKEVNHEQFEGNERNKRKLEGFGVKPRFGEESFIDMFEEQREDN